MGRPVMCSLESRTAGDIGDTMLGTLTHVRRDSALTTFQRGSDSGGSGGRAAGAGPGLRRNRGAYLAST